MLRKLAFWLRVAWGIVAEHVVGIECSGCGSRTAHPAPRDWRVQTLHDGEVGWRCGDCARCDESLQYH